MTSPEPRYIIGMDLAAPGGESMVIFDRKTSTFLRFDACARCDHWTADHLVSWGPLQLCLEDGCACGRRALGRSALAMAPWLPVLAAGVYLAYHLVLWASRGFLVRAW
jgi:hypothetical protein